MDGLHSLGAAGSSTVGAPLHAVQAVARSDSRAKTETGAVRRLDDVETVVLTKTVAGFDRAWIETAHQTVRDAAAGRLGQLKFIAFDFAHPGDEEAVAGKGFDALVTDLADLILHAPVVSVGYARGSLSGADLELALACSMLVGEECARFSFAADPVSSVRTYGFLARKIGFVRAERLMERGEVLDAAQMRDLFLLKDVVKGGAGLAGLDQFLRQTLRRHNSAYGIYRAQRIATSSALAPGARS